MTREFALIYGLLVLERTAELALSRRNARRLQREGGEERDATFSRAVIAFHTAWLGAFLLEGGYRDAAPEVGFLWVIVAFLALQAGRYWCVATLGRFWNARVWVLPGAAPVHRGPYRFMRHPNYLVVLVEIPLLPALFGCVWTAAAFGIANAFVLRRRIAGEEAAMGESSG